KKATTFAAGRGRTSRVRWSVDRADSEPRRVLRRSRPQASLVLFDSESAEAGRRHGRSWPLGLGSDGRHRSIHSTTDPALSVTIMTRRTRSLWYITLAPARAAWTDG